MNEVLQHLAADGVKIARREDGVVELSHLPKPRRSNPNFLSQEFAAFEESERTRDRAAPAADG